MRTIVIASRKGGAGKTTLCMNLSVQAERDGDGPIYILDTDPQGSLRTWHNRRQAEAPIRMKLPPEIGITGGVVKACLDQVEEIGGKYCLIDTPPHEHEVVNELIAMADLVIVPVRPSPADLWAVGRTIDVAKKSSTPFLFVLSQVNTRAALTAQAAAILSEHGHVMNSFISNRVLYAAAVTDGRAAIEVEPKGQAAQEIAALWQQIKGIMEGATNGQVTLDEQG